MKSCLTYYGKADSVFKEVDEIILNIKKIKDLNDLEAFCEQYKKQTIILYVEEWLQLDELLYKFIFDFQKKYNNIYNIKILLPNWNDSFMEKIHNDYPESKIFFISLIQDWDNLIFFIKNGVTDVYISNELGFELEQISKICHKNNVKIRVFPNVAQSSYPIDDILKFWIRPEDIEFYDNYIDVYEFFGDIEKQKIYYNIYMKDKKWNGNLKEIIISLNEDINNMTILPRFPYKRVKCMKKCLKGNKCNLCFNILDLSKTLEKSNLKISNKKNKEE